MTGVKNVVANRAGRAIIRRVCVCLPLCLFLSTLESKFCDWRQKFGGESRWARDQMKISKFDFFFRFVNRLFVCRCWKPVFFVVVWYLVVKPWPAAIFLCVWNTPMVMFVVHGGVLDGRR